MSRKSFKSRVLLNRTPDRLSIDIPPRGSRAAVPRRTIVTALLLGLVTLFSVIVLASMRSMPQTLLGAIVILLSFWLLALLAWRSLTAVVSDSHHLTVDRDRFEIVWQRRGHYHPLAQGQTADLEKATVEVYVRSKGGRTSRLVLWEGIQPQDFGLTAEGAALTEEEQAWLAGEINDFLQQLQPQK